MNKQTKISIIKWTIIITIIIAILGTASYLWMQHIESEMMSQQLYGAPAYRPDTE